MRFLKRIAGHLRPLMPVGDGFDVAALPPADRAEFFTYFDSARARLDGAAALRESGHSIPALLLYRDGVSMLARAHAVSSRTGGAEDATAGDRFTAFIASKHEPTARVLRQDLTSSSEPPDALNPRELALRVAELGAVMPDVLALMTPRSPEREARRSALRNVIVIAGLLASVVAIASYVVRPKNIALHKHATGPSVAFDAPPSGAVNGRIYENFGYHSDHDPSPWLRIDLGGVYDITRIRVFGRHDCCFSQSIPMVVELSKDGSDFTTLAERTQPFDQIDPWEIVPDQPARARYVQVRKTSKGLLVLAEVEVYGHPAR